jgi:butyrate kinase
LKKEKKDDDCMFAIFVINPGSVSTKLSLYHDETPVWNCTKTYSNSRTVCIQPIMKQLDGRFADMMEVIQSQKLDIHSFSAVVSRGGPFKPLEGGTYQINPELLQDVREGRVQAEHISSIGILMADRLTRDTQIPSFFVDPVSVDELESLARPSGMPELERKSLVHALNIKAVSRKVAARLNRDPIECSLIAAHLGTGISICPIQRGRIVDVNNSAEEGPFSPQRTGSLPVSSLAKLCYSGKYTYSEMKRKIFGDGGLVAYLDTNDAKIVEDRIHEGDSYAKLIYQAMAYQIAKEIGAMSTVLKGKIDGILLTGGLAHSKLLIGWIEERVAFLGPVFVFPGEFEMEALALGALRVLRGAERAKSYGKSG